MAELDATVTYIVDNGFIALYKDKIRGADYVVQMYQMHSRDFPLPKIGEVLQLNVQGTQATAYQQGLPVYRGTLPYPIDSVQAVRSQSTQLFIKQDLKNEPKLPEQKSSTLDEIECLYPPHTD